MDQDTDYEAEARGYLTQAGMEAPGSSRANYFLAKAQVLATLHLAKVMGPVMTQAQEPSGQPEGVAGNSGISEDRRYEPLGEEYHRHGHGVAGWLSHSHASGARPHVHAGLDTHYLPEEEPDAGETPDLGAVRVHKLYVVLGKNRYLTVKCEECSYQRGGFFSMSGQSLRQMLRNHREDIRSSESLRRVQDGKS